MVPMLTKLCCLATEYPGAIKRSNLELKRLALPN